MTLNLNALRVFAAVAEAQGFSKAAARLRLSQPAVSKAVLGLERQVGLPLLERGAGGVRLTDAGAGLLERARELFAVERAAEEELRARLGLERGVLRIGASTTIATYLLPPLLGTFQAGYPGIDLRVTSANTRHVARALLQRALDVALVEGPVAAPRILHQPWREDELVIIAPPDHYFLRVRKRVPVVTVDALAGERFIARERGSGTRAVAEAALTARGVQMRIALTLGSTEAVKQAVAAGLGLAVVSRDAAADQLALGRVGEVRVANLTIRRQLTLLRLSGVRASAPGAAFEALLLSDTLPGAGH